MRHLGQIIIFYLAVFVLSGNSFALDLGEMTVKSYINQPLKAEIEVFANPGEIASLEVRLARERYYERMLLPYPPSDTIRTINFQIKKNEEGNKATILLSTPSAIKEEAFIFAIEVNAAEDRDFGRYQVSLEAPPPTVIALPEPELVPIIEPVTIISTDNNMEIVVVKGDTLWDIAGQFKDADHSMGQIMLAMQRATPDAFGNNNINFLKIGAILRAPKAEDFNQMSQQEVQAQVLSQQALWNDYVAKVTTASTSVPVASDDGGIRGSDGGGQVGSDSLSLLIPSDGASKGSLDELGKRVALLEEQLDASRIERQELQSRIADLVARLSKFDELQKIMTIESDSLALLQADQAQKETGLADNMSVGVEASTDAEPILPAPVIGAELERKEPPAFDGTLSLSAMLENPVVPWGVLAVVIVLLSVFLYKGRKDDSGKGSMAARPNEDTIKAGAKDESLQAATIPQSGLDKNKTVRPTTTGQNDVLNEVDVYLAYGLYDSAEALLKQHIDKNPDRADYRAKLLDTYFAMKDTNAFVRESKRLKSLGSASEKYWDEVQRMGYKLAPDFALFSAAKSNGSVANHEGTKLNGLDEFMEPNIDMDDTSESLPNDVDAISTKLDLARAFIDMGDGEGARASLGEVLDEGTDAQKAEAGLLLKKI